MFFEKNFNGVALKGPGQRSEKNLILVFKVMVQPPKTHFMTEKSETKIMKITHSVYVKIKGWTNG